MAQNSSAENEGMNVNESQESARFDQRNFICDVCGKSFLRKIKLVEHIRTHTGEKPYKCTHCGHSFTQMSNLTQHLRTQTGGGPYQCSKCGESFATNCILSKHKVTHVGNKPHKCTECEKSFTYNSQLNRHMLIHTGEKPFKCNYCEKPFNRKSHLKTHEQRKHKKEKKNRCHHCNSLFTTLERFQRHIELHTSLQISYIDKNKCEFAHKLDFKRPIIANGKEITHKCDKCGVSFLFSSGLKRHLLSHSLSKPHVCGYRQKILKYIKIWRYYQFR